MNTAADPCVARYRDLKNLKLVGAELGMPWQTVYWRLKKAGEPVTGDKARYGSETDLLAARGERWFAAMVPSAEDRNAEAFQANVDFIARGRSVDVKVARPHRLRGGSWRWGWSIKKQEAVADFFVCIGLQEINGDLRIVRLLLIPGEIARTYQTIGLGTARPGKWAQYSVTAAELRDFFEKDLVQ